jgi:hypothetical protein
MSITTSQQSAPQPSAPNIYLPPAEGLPRMFEGNEDFLKYAVDRSPHGIAIVRARGAVSPDGKTCFHDEDGWDHVAVVYKDRLGEYKVLELVPGGELRAAGFEAAEKGASKQTAKYLGSDNAPRSFSEFSKAYQRYDAVPARFDNGDQANKFLQTVNKEQFFSFLGDYPFGAGHTSASTIAKANSEATGKSFERDLIPLKPIIEALETLAKAKAFKDNTSAFMNKAKELLESFLSKEWAGAVLEAMKNKVGSPEEKVKALGPFKNYSFNNVTPSEAQKAFGDERYDSEELGVPKVNAGGEPGGVAIVLASLLGAALVPQVEHPSDDTPIASDTTTDGDEGASHSEQVAASDPATDHDEGASQEQIAVASDTTTDGDEGASHSEQVAASDPATDHDEGASQDQIAVASDTTTDGDEGASHSGQVATASDTTTDGDEGASHSEQVATASDTTTDGDEGASHSVQVALETDTGDASKDAGSQPEPSLVEDRPFVEPWDREGVKEVLEKEFVQTAKAEVGLTLDDQAGPPSQPATSAVFSQEDSLSFSAFAKQGTPAEVANQGMPAEFAKQGMPADQLPAEAISTPGAPAGESAHHEVGSEDVGNAAPSKEPVVHHGDLTP